MRSIALDDPSKTEPTTDDLNEFTAILIKTPEDV